MVPYYEEASDFTCKTYKTTFNKVNEIQAEVENKVGLVKRNVLQMKNDIQT